MDGNPNGGIFFSTSRGRAPRIAPTAYTIAEIFASLQGEGFYTGHRAVFVRLAGCSVTRCHIRKDCDTDYGKRETLTAPQILARVRAFCRDGIVVLTGGEPTDRDLTELVHTLKEAHYRVHLETSGVRLVRPGLFDWITVSPKTRDYVQRRGDVLKVVLRPGWGWAALAEIDQGTVFSFRYVQPLTDSSSGNPVNLNEVIALVRSADNAGGRWALSTQAHRQWGLP
jgi:7-carboxy-7-deazaguanine synthase